MKISPTSEFYNDLDKAFDFYNEKLFDGMLNKVFFTVRSGENKSKKTKTLGYYWKNVFAHKENPISEIALNISTFSNRTTLDILSTLVHEMVHQWREEISGEINKGKDSNGGHDKVWSNKMIELGLIPTNTGLPGGRKTGKNMSHYIDENGLFSKHSKELIKSGFVFEIFDSYGSAINSSLTFSLNPVNVKVLENWLEGEVETEEIDKIKKSLSSLSDDESIVQEDMHNLVVVKKPKKITDKPKTIKYKCENCLTSISGPENLEVVCYTCNEFYKPIIKNKK